MPVLHFVIISWEGTETLPYNFCFLVLRTRTSNARPYNFYFYGCWCTRDVEVAVPYIVVTKAIDFDSPVRQICVSRLVPPLPKITDFGDPMFCATGTIHCFEMAIKKPAPYMGQADLRYHPNWHIKCPLVRL